MNRIVKKSKEVSKQETNLSPSSMSDDKKREVLDAVQKVYTALDISRQIIGVRLLHTKEEYELSNAKSFPKKITYCIMVKTAMNGHCLKSNLDGFACLPAARALGIQPPSNEWLTGNMYRSKFMYKDLGTAKKVVENTSCIMHKVYGTELMPLEAFQEEPHIVIIVTNPYNIMRLVQGYTYAFGTYAQYKLIGNQALCSECTAYPFESDEINLSVMCSGTRYMCGWKEEEMGLGIPFRKFLSMADGLWKTVNIMENNRGKQRIFENQKIMAESAEGLPDILRLELQMSKNYFTGEYIK